MRALTTKSTTRALLALSPSTLQSPAVDIQKCANMFTKRGIIIPRQTFKVKGYQPELYLNRPGGCTCAYCQASSFSTSKSGRVGSVGDDDKKKSQLSALEDQVAELKKKLDEQARDNIMHEFYDAADKPTDPDVEVILDNNRKWHAKQLEKDPEFFNRVGGPQHPKYLYIGCSDSRVPANEILGLGPGEVFVHRNVGNQVNGSDLNVLSVLEFAVGHLGVKHIIVTGHYDCGAVRASLKKQDLGLLENWLRPIRDVYRIHHSQLTNIKDEEVKHRRLVELNVMEQALNIYKIGVVQRKRKACKEASLANGEQKDHNTPSTTYPKIHAFVFDPKVGLLHKLPIDFKKTITQYKDVYTMY